MSSRIIPDFRRLTHAQRTALGWTLVALAVLVVLAGYHSTSVVVVLIVAAVVALTTRGHLRQTPATSGPAPTSPPGQEYAFSPPPGAVVPPSAAFSAGVRAPMPPSYSTPSYTTEPRPAEQPWQQPVAAPPRPRPRALNSALISVAVLVSGLYLLIGRAGAYDTSVLKATAVGLAALGIGLVATAWRARSRWALALGAVMTVFLMLGSAIQDNWGTSVDSRVWRPTSTSAIPYEYKLAAGNATLDLRQVGPGLVGTTVRVRMGAGKVVVIVPDNVPASANGYVGLGEFNAFGLQYKENPTRQTVVTPGWTTAAAGVRVLIHLGAGNAEVRHG